MCVHTHTHERLTLLSNCLLRSLGYLVFVMDMVVQQLLNLLASMYFCLTFCVIYMPPSTCGNKLFTTASEQGPHFCKNATIHT